MIKIFHINPESLDAGECKSLNGKCPFGNADQHYTTKAAARESVEEELKPFVVKTVRQIVSKLEKQGIIANEFTSWMKAESYWSDNEKAVVKLLDETYEAYAVKDHEVIYPLIQRISGLHFAKEMLSMKELRILTELEKVQKQWLGKATK